ncbi:hypothetical protein PPACK8108_LOCUS19314 [Phakopsora pachyrhizi]|uniref:Uncharacterized protein n=1 Tax=Phakopsora pachyrhizi TaxID=170000 RepID=A0AAV0BG68_PHAPC|nr:hypothetical protein PPACK8108_LOCUS19314 [Phakopsora pachyrhizi]
MLRLIILSIILLLSSTNAIQQTKQAKKSNISKRITYRSFNHPLLTKRSLELNSASKASKYAINSSKVNAKECGISDKATKVGNLASTSVKKNDPGKNKIIKGIRSLVLYPKKKKSLGKTPESSSKNPSSEKALQASDKQNDMIVKELPYPAYNVEETQFDSSPYYHHFHDSYASKSFIEIKKDKLIYLSLFADVNSTPTKTTNFMEDLYTYIFSGMLDIFFFTHKFLLFMQNVIFIIIR